MPSVQAALALGPQVYWTSGPEYRLSAAAHGGAVGTEQGWAGVLAARSVDAAPSGQVQDSLTAGAGLMMAELSVKPPVEANDCEFALLQQSANHAEESVCSRLLSQ